MSMSILSWFRKKSDSSAIKTDDSTVKDINTILGKAEQTEVVLAEKVIKDFAEIFSLLEKAEKGVEKTFALVETGEAKDLAEFDTMVQEFTSNLSLINTNKKHTLYTDVKALNEVCEASLKAANTLEFVLKQHGLTAQDFKEIGALEDEEKRILSDIKDFSSTQDKIFLLVKDIIDLDERETKERVKKLRSKMGSLSTNLLKCDRDLKDIAKILNDTGLFLKRAHQKGIVLDTALNNVLSLIYSGKIPPNVQSEDDRIRQIIRDAKDGIVYHKVHGETLIKTSESTKILRKEYENANR